MAAVNQAYSSLRFRGDTLRHDVLTNLAARADQPMITVVGRRGRGVESTGADLLQKATETLMFWQNYLGAGTHVLIAALPAGEVFLISLIASLIGEGTLIPVSPPRQSDPDDRLARIAQSSGATAVLCTSQNRDAVERQLRDADGASACHVLVLDAPKKMTPTSDRAGPRAYPIVQYTSGSTRFPKAVPITAQQIRENCRLIQTQWNMNPDTVLVNWLPHYHDMGLMGCIVYPLLSAAHSVQMSPFDMIRRPLSWLEAVSDYRGTISGGPTFAFLECLNRIPEDASRSLDLRSWTHAFCGAEPIPRGMLDRFHARFAANGLSRDAVFACYGMAECTLFAAGEAGLSKEDPDLPAAWSLVEGCLLSAVTRAMIRIADPTTGQPLADGCTGEICLTGPSVCHAYLGQDAGSPDDFFTDRDGRTWLRTGDLGGMRAGYLYITGRKKDVVIVNGRNVASAEVEWLAAREHPDLNPAAAAAIVPADIRSGHARLLIELRTGAAPLDAADMVAEHIRKVVAASCGVALDDILFLRRGSLPRTSSGKIKRQQATLDFDLLKSDALYIAVHQPEEANG